MEPVMHFAIPFTIAFLLGLRLKGAFLTGLIAILPDFDVFFFMHRSVSHSIIPTIVLVLIFLLLLRNNRLKAIPQLTALGWGSHVILDFIGGYTPILWPLSQSSYMLIFESKIHMGSLHTLSFALKVLEEPYGYGVFTTLDAPLFTAEGLAVALLLITLTSIGGWRGLGFITKRSGSGR